MQAWLIAVVGGAAAILLATLILWLIRRLKRKDQKVSDGQIGIGDNNTGIAIGDHISQRIKKDTQNS